MTAKANAGQSDDWNGESGRRWVADADRRDRVLGPVADELLTVAAPQAGEQVLDIGCGCGITTLRAAAAVGPHGRAVGVDLSEPMLALAQQRQDDRDVDNAVFVQADAQEDPLGEGFDLAISRFGTMFFADPVSAFRNIADSFRSGGRLCLATWQPLAANDWLLVPGAALLEFGTMPPAEAWPGMFAQSEPGEVSAVLDEAGLTDIDLRPVTLDLPLGATIDDAAAYLAESGPGRALLATIERAQHQEALSAVRRVLGEHASEDGSVALSAGVWLITARS